MYEDARRIEWGRKIMEKARQVKRDYKREYCGEVDITEALLGVVTRWGSNSSIPSVLIRTSDGLSDEGLVQVFYKIKQMMQTPSYHTINFTNPKIVDLVEGLCLKDSITGGCPERDASYVLDAIIGFDDRWRIYRDQFRSLPQYASEIRENLDAQFGQVRVEIALHDCEEFKDFLYQCMGLAYAWEEWQNAKNGTTGMDAIGIIESGFDSLTDHIPEGSKDPISDAIDSLVMEKIVERLPYSTAAHVLRGIPHAIY